MQALLAEGADIKVRDKQFDQTALTLAAWSGSADAVAASHPRGRGRQTSHTQLGPMPSFVEPNAGRASHGDGILRGGVPERGSRPPRAGQMTALHYAAREGHTDVAAVLLANGANVNAAGGERRTAVAAGDHERSRRNGAVPHRARRGCERRRLVRAYAARGPPWTLATSSSMASSIRSSPIATARSEIIKLLLARGANPNARTRESPPGRIWLMQAGSLSWVDFTGQTPFLRAALAGDVTTMRLLLENKADPNIATFGGTTPLMAAAGVNWVYFQTFDEGQDQLLEAVKLCVSLGQDVNAANSMGVRAIHGAANRGSDAIVKYLVEQGAQPRRERQAGALDAHTWAEGVFLATHAAVPKPSTMKLIEELCRSIRTSAVPPLVAGTR